MSLFNIPQILWIKVSDRRPTQEEAKTSGYIISDGANVQTGSEYDYSGEYSIVLRWEGGITHEAQYWTIIEMPDVS